MKIYIFTPTQRPGIDVTINSIKRQNIFGKEEIRWVLCDELYYKRERNFWDEHAPRAKGFTMASIFMHKDNGNKRNLARAYNYALESARAWGADIFISLQDYIYVPEDGVEKFANLSDSINNPHIITGICDISSDPFNFEVVDINDPYSIFSESYNDKPKVIGWQDCRRQNGSGLFRTTPIEWETNWACIGRKALYNTFLSFDEKFDRYVAYENQDYAAKADSLGYDIVLDFDNVVISLPHKEYFKESWQEEEPLTIKNKEYLESKGYGSL